MAERANKLPRWMREPRWLRNLEAPDCPPGWRTGPPDFVGVGAQRAGTSWWHASLAAHPDVVRVEGQPKELHYFDRFWPGEAPTDRVERYHAFFPRPAGAITGEWTPRYMYDFWSLELLREAAPEARILVLLRDPVERYRSGLGRHLRRSGRDPESNSLPMNLSMVADALSRGLYHAQLRVLFEHFAPEQVLVLQFERCVQDPEPELAATCRFLGLEPVPGLAEAGRRARPAKPNPELSPGTRAGLVARLSADVAAVAELCPQVDLSLWPNFRHLAPAPSRDFVATARDHRGGPDSG